MNNRKTKKVLHKRLPVNPAQKPPQSDTDQPAEPTQVTPADEPDAVSIPADTPQIAMDTTDVNLEDSGFLEPVIKREYAENPTATLGGESTPQPANEPAADQAPEPAPEPAPAPRPFFGPPKLQSSKPAADAPAGEASSDQPTAPPIPTMQFQKPIISTAPDADPLGRQVGEQVGMTTSEWAFGILENFYPEVVYFFSKIDSTFVEKANLPADLEISLIQKIMAQNAKIKGRVQISEFHKKNILPPLKRILATKGWENVIPDEVMLIAGLVMLAGDTFFKINAIRKENRLLVKEIRQDIEKYVGLVSKQDSKVAGLEAQIAQMTEMMKAMQEQQQRGPL